MLEKTLESPLGCKEIQTVHPKGNQSWVFIGRTDAEPTLQSFGHLMRRTDSFEKTLMLGKIESGRRGDDRGWDGWMASPTRWTWVWVNSRSWWWTGRPGVLRFMGSQSRIQLSDWTELNWCNYQSQLCQKKKAAVCFPQGPNLGLMISIIEREMLIPYRYGISNGQNCPQKCLVGW